MINPIASVRRFLRNVDVLARHATWIEQETQIGTLQAGSGLVIDGADICPAATGAQAAACRWCSRAVSDSATWSENRTSVSGAGMVRDRRRCSAIGPGFPHALPRHRGGSSTPPPDRRRRVPARVPVRDAAEDARRHRGCRPTPSRPAAHSFVVGTSRAKRTTAARRPARDRVRSTSRR